MYTWRFWIYGTLTSLLAFECLFLIASTGTPDIMGIVNRAESSIGGEVELLTPPYTLDEVYLSMRGPRSNQPRIRLSERSRKKEETLWITGIETGVVDAHSLEPISNEYFCHSNLTLNPDTSSPEIHNANFKNTTHADWRLFTLVPGRISVFLPEGFGVPIKSRTLLDYFTMALNQNAGEPNREIRMRSKLSYTRVSRNEVPPKPLFRRALYVYQQHSTELGYSFDLVPHYAEHLGEICAEHCRSDQRGNSPSAFSSDLDNHPGSTCCVVNASIDGIVSQFGEENTVHWMVPPGFHQYRTEVTEQLELPFDSTAHYVTGHLHPFGKALRLVDLESGDTVFDISAKSFRDRLGVEWISEIKSSSGIPLSRDRRYELIAEYDNPMDSSIDAMAILYVYLLDQDLK